jgi:hypothetical protein
VFWIKKTIRKVTIVVDVLITSCQVSLKWNIGPLMPHTTTSTTAITNVAGLPAIVERPVENFENQLLFVTGRSCRVKSSLDDTHSAARAPPHPLGLAAAKNPATDFRRLRV